MGIQGMDEVVCKCGVIGMWSLGVGESVRCDNCGDVIYDKSKSKQTSWQKFRDKKPKEADKNIQYLVTTMDIDRWVLGSPTLATWDGKYFEELRGYRLGFHEDEEVVYWMEIPEYP